MGLIDRIKELALIEHKSISAFEDNVNISRGYLGVLKKRKSNPGVDLIETIVNKYPDYNVRWLITGEGEMKIKKETSQEEARFEDIIAQKVSEDLKPILIKLLKGVGNLNLDFQEIKNNQEEMKQLQERTIEKIR